jgi:general nucleoside transport system permease protein
MKPLALPPRLGAAAALLGPPLAVLAGGFGLVLAISSDPVLAYRDLLFANFHSASNFALFVNRTTPLLLIGLSVVLSFRAGVFNVGGEGQLYLGAMAATVAALASGGAPGPVGLILAAAAGAAIGALYALVPAQLKVRLGVNEVVSTLMLNFIALLLTQYLVTHPLRDPVAYGAVSFMLAKSEWLPEIPGLPGATSGALIAIVLAPLTWLLLYRTTWGAELRAAGTNLRFAEAVGIDAGRRVLEAMALSGAVAGLAGALYVLGVGHRFEQNFSPGFGLIGLTVALLARLNPLGVLATAAFYALVLNGAAYMQIDTDVPRSLVGLLTGFLVLFMTARGPRASAAA